MATVDKCWSQFGPTVHGTVAEENKVLISSFYFECGSLVLQFTVLYLEYGSVVEQSKQLQQVIQDVAFLFLHPQDVWRMEWFGAVYLQLLVEWKEAKLEKILDDNGNLRTQTGMQNVMPAKRLK